ncbi:succinate-semialdehyde dehydrogenase/glutarate-semialdehyde dehydrogenase [Nonomuraea polychroma]|uniref:Succinate-semialdehyde dehydrogenase/glutarate-semialdehyde dehydrogenase n=1 Tax=Nonomuraea polychroma TaxID=46176 RepID=A0A438M8D8_9ACTN|nr:aldehyde dehydrogenase family protein [Nonomuraea polychroma]RVX41948.1 succinate-semialdehyde dehydrogenase/glutarate-semialdehyde dehydrogenase [Nonomuraea polychroma]
MQDDISGVRLSGRQHAGDGTRYEVVEPATGRTIGHVTAGTGRDAARAVDVAAASLEGWRATPAPQRGAVLRAITRRLRTADDLAETVARETGKCLREASAELALAADYFDWYADLAHTLTDQAHSVRPGLRHLVRTGPVGVAAVLTPWNFPVSIPARKIAPALATGCAVVFKPSELSLLSSLAFAELCESELPEGLLNTVAGDGPEISGAWLDDSRVRLLHFTGSTAVGRTIARAAGAALTPVVMELGGRAPFIVLPDADLDEAADTLMVAKFRNNGASCIAANNIWVHHDIRADFLDRLAARVSALVPGDPLDERTTLGPVRTPEMAARLEGLVAALGSAGARVHQGRRPESSGWYVAPALIVDPATNRPEWREEVFGPVALVRSFADLKEPIIDASATAHGLAGYVCTGDAAAGAELLARLDVGIASVNVATPTTPEIPFGGRGDSGIGYEGGLPGLLPFLAHQSIAVPRP